MVPIYVLNDVVGLIRIAYEVKYLFEYVMVKRIEYLLIHYHAYIQLDLNDVMMTLKLLLWVMVMHVQLKMMMMLKCYCYVEMKMMNLSFPMVLKKYLK
jgi:hypothetical protein